MPRKRSKNTYMSLYLKLRRRDGRIEKLNAKIDQLISYIKRRGLLVRQLRYRYRALRSEFQEYKKQVEPFLRFMKSPIEKRRFNLLDYMLRLNKTIIFFNEEITTNEIVILIYLSMVEYSGYTQMMKDLDLGRRVLTKNINLLAKKEMVNSGKTKGVIYVYITEEGKRGIKTFQEQMIKQKVLGL